MRSKLFVAVNVVGLVCVYVAIIYACTATFDFIADSYSANLAMLRDDLARVLRI